MDFRSTIYNKFPSPIKIKFEKQKLENNINQHHPRSKNTYNQLSNADSPYRDNFLHIYDYTCAYCGCNVEVISIDKLEIDHFKNKTSFENVSESGSIFNLICSCYDCNRSKLSYEMDAKYLQLLYPDSEEFKKIFYRDEDYYIKINQEYQYDTIILEFYNKLRLGSQSKRLDYLFLNVIGLNKKLKTIKAKNDLDELVFFLSQKRKLHVLKKENVISNK